MLEFRSYALIFAGFLNILLCLFVLARNVKNASNIAFAAISLGLGGWTIGIAGFLLTQDPTIAKIWAKIYYFFPQVVASSIVIFAYTFARRKPVSRGFLYLVFAGFFSICLPLILIPTFVTQDLVFHDWGKEIILNKVHYLAYSVYLLVCLISAEVFMLRKSLTLSGVYRSQASLFFWGFIITGVLGVLYNLIFPWFGNYKMIWLGPLFTSVFVIAISYSIVKHKMFDIRLILARSLAYVFLILVLGFSYGLIAFNLVSDLVLGSTEIGLVERIFYTLLAISIAFTFQPIKRFFDKQTNKLFYRDAYDSQLFLDKLNQVLVSNIELEKLLLKSSEVIGGTIKSEFCLFEVKKTDYEPRRIVGIREHKFSDKDFEKIRLIATSKKAKAIVTDELDDDGPELHTALRDNNIAVLVRLTDSPEKSIEGLGHIILGFKKSGNPYSSQDIKILEIIADELVIAIQNALRFEEIEQFNITLQGKVEEATKNLRKANERLKELDQTKDDFISMASHQLRTPLTSVKGYVSMVLEGDVGKISTKQKELLDQAFVSSQRMVYLIADLLNVSRLKTGKFIIEAKPTNLADVVEGEIKQLTETAKGRNLELSYDKPKQFPELMLDETKIRQVIMNFADNAIYYTPAGGHIKVAVEDKGETIEFTVTDDGIGVPKAEQHHMFNKFYRAGNAKKARPDGTGLGLFMAKKVVVAQGGAIIFNSQEGKGSTFGFSFAKKRLLPEYYKGPVISEVTEKK